MGEAEAAAEESLRQWQHTDEETEQGSNQRRRRIWRYGGGTHLAGHWTTVQGRRRKLLPAEKSRRMVLLYHCSAWRQVSARALLVPARHRRWNGRRRPALWRSGLLVMKRDDGEKSIEAVKLINLTTSNHNFLFYLMFVSPSMHSTSYSGICPSTAVPSSSALLYALLMRSAMHGVRRCSYHAGSFWPMKAVPISRFSRVTPRGSRSTEHI